MGEGRRKWVAGGGEKSGVGEGRSPLAGGRRRREAGGAGRACWSGIWLGDGGGTGLVGSPPHRTGLNLLTPCSPSLQASLPPHEAWRGS